MKVFRKTALLISVIVLAVVLAVGAVAGVALLSEGNATLGEEYSAVQVTTDGKVNLKVYYSTLGSAEKFVTEVVDPVTEEVDYTYTYTVAELGEATENGYCVKVPLAPSQMTHTVRVWAAAGDTKSEVREFTVADYANDVLAKESLSDYHDAMRTLLNWGAMAQSKFADATSVRADVGLFERGSNSIYGVNTIKYEKGEVNPGTTITGNTMNLSLEPGNIVLHFYVNYTGSGTLTATVSKDGGEAVDTEITESAQGWHVTVANVPATMFDTPYTVTVTDGTDTFTATKTIREYLGVLLAQCNDNGDLATGNTVRALYQFYQIVTGETGAADCAHNQKFYYWVADGADTSSVRCNQCHTVLGTGISNDVNAYAHAGTLQTVGVTGKVDKTLKTEDGVQFVRYNNFYANRDNWGDISLGGSFVGVEGVTGQYLVIKYRTGAQGNSWTTFQTYSNTNKGSETGLTGKGQANIVASKDDQWHTVIINLAERVTDPSITFVDEGDGTYNVRYLSMRAFAGSSKVDTDDAEGRYTYVYSYTDANDKVQKETYYGVALTEEALAAKVETYSDYALFNILKQSVSADAYLDLAYVALCDSEAEAKSLIDTAVYEKSTANDKSLYFNTADDSCVHPSRDSEEYIEGNTYSYAKCAQCGECLISRTLEDSVKLYFSPYKISVLSTADPTNARVHYNLGNKAFTIDNEAYFSFTGKDGAAQFIWNRTGFSTDQAYTMDIGLANYAVIKMRVSTTDLSNNFGLVYSTTGVDSNLNSAIPVASATAGEWETYVIDLAKVYGAQHALDAESGTYKVDTLYFHCDGLASTTKIDIAYMAFVEGDWDDVEKIIDTDTALVQTVKNGAAQECPADDLERLDVVGLEWNAQNLYDLATIKGQAPYYSSWQGAVNNITVETEDGETFLRLNDATCSDWGGWFPYQSSSASNSGNNRYMVLKVRRNSNIADLSQLNFWITSMAGYGGTWAAGGFSVALGQDNTWHTIVVDLATRCGDAYKADANGNYDPRTIHIRPFGGGTSYNETTDETFDIAYWAFFSDLKDASYVIEDETYEFSVSNTSSVVMDTKTGACVDYCSPAYVADAEDARGYHYECSICGKVYAMDYYTSSTGRKGHGSATVSTATDEAGFGYQSFLATGDGAFFDYIANSGPGGGALSAHSIHTGRFLVVKLRGNTTADVKFYIGTDDIAMYNNNYQGTSVGVLTSETMPEDWTVAILDLSTLERYSVLESHKFYFSSTTGGGSLVSAGAQVDIAYVMIADSLAAATELAGNDTVKFYGNFNNEPVDLTDLCDGTNHTYSTITKTNDGATVKTSTCLGCGYTKVQTVSADINWFSSLSSMGKYIHTLEKNLYDAENGVSYNRYTRGGATGGNHLNLTHTDGGAGSPTSGTFTTGKYVAIKYRLWVEGGTGTFGFNVGTGAASGSSLGTLDYTTIEQGEWRVAFIDASGAAKWTSDGTAKSIYMMITVGGTGEYTFDIAWAAVVDSPAELQSLLTEGETYFDLGTSWANAGVELEADGTCPGECVADVIATSHTGYTYYTNTCPCGAIDEEFAYTEISVGSPNLKVNHKITAEDTGDYKFTATNTTCELIYRDPWRQNGGAINVGDSKYAVIRVKNGTLSNTNLSFRFSTEPTGENYKDVVDEETGEVTGQKVTSDKSKSVTLVLSEEYTTYVIDLASVGSAVYLTSEDGNYYIDDCYFLFRGAVDEYFYIDTIAFTSDWAQIDALVEDAQATLITSAGNSQVNVADGTPAN